MEPICRCKKECKTVFVAHRRYAQRWNKNKALLSLSSFKRMPRGNWRPLLVVTMTRARIETSWIQYPTQQHCDDLYWQEHHDECFLGMSLSFSTRVHFGMTRTDKYTTCLPWCIITFLCVDPETTTEDDVLYVMYTIGVSSCALWTTSNGYRDREFVCSLYRERRGVKVSQRKDVCALLN